MSRRRDYCFTINNWTATDEDEITKLGQSEKTRYLIVAKEIGENGTPHLQCYVYFHNAHVFAALKKMLSRAAIFPCRGSPEQNIAYCSKGGNFVETGTRPLSQKRKGAEGLEYWETNKKLAIEGKLDEICPKLYLTHYRTLRAIGSDHLGMPPDNDDYDNQWYWGKTGTGKSYKARTENPGCYLKMCNKWWDGYQNEETVLIEDFDKTHVMLGHHLKIWADRYAFPAEIKGSKINLRPKRIIVTSNWHPADIWGAEPQTLEPIERRFRIKQFH